MKKQLIIRQATEVDLKDILLFEFRNREWFSQFLPRAALRQQTEYYFQRTLTKQAKHLQYLVFLPDNVLIGRFYGQKLTENSVEISYRISKCFSNKGIASYVLRHILLVWASYGITEVYAQVAEHNIASIKLLLSHGFVFDEIQKNAINLAPKIYNCWVFRWSADDDSSTFSRVPSDNVLTG